MAKVDRAKELFQNLAAEIAEFSATPWYHIDRHERLVDEAERARLKRVVEQYERDGTPYFPLHEAPQLHAVDFFVKFDRKPALSKWSVQVGEVVQHLRSALDHAVFQLARQHTGKATPPGANELQFPITRSHDQFQRGKGRNLRGIRDAEVRVIESIQPYHGAPMGGSLRILQHLNNSDKHRELALTALRPAAFSLTGMTTLDGGHTPLSRTNRGPIQEELPTVTVWGPNSLAGVQLGANLEIYPSLEELPTQAGPVRAHINRVLPTLGRDIETIVKRLLGG